jgi:alpha-tubulin suppressor-like RCC1 family protein
MCGAGTVESWSVVTGASTYYVVVDEQGYIVAWGPETRGPEGALRKLEVAARQVEDEENKDE